MNNSEVQNKPWILVTGGSRGIGKAIVKMLASHQWQVIFTYNSSSDAALSLESEVERSGGAAKGFKCDGSDFSQVEKLCRDLQQYYGNPAGLINNMGITADELIYNLDIETYQKVINTNLNSSVYFSKCLVPMMSENGYGKIIQMSSVTAFKGNKGQIGYAATKAAMLGITKSLSLEVARFNITVNAVAPGFIATEMVDQIPEKTRKNIKKEIPLKRMGEVDEVASLVRFLVSKEADYITGQTFVIDGGLTV